MVDDLLTDLAMGDIMPEDALFEVTKVIVKASEIKAKEKDE